MIDHGYHSGFSQKAFLCFFWRARRAKLQNLDGDFATNRDVLAHEDSTHRTFAKKLVHLDTARARAARRSMSWAI